MNIENLIVANLGVKLLNGKIKPKYGVISIITVIIMLLFFIFFIFAFIYGLITFNTEFIIMPALGMFGMGYLLLISPYTQNSNHYYIEFQNENTLTGFKLSYKGKLVNIKYIVANDGKIAFANNKSKLDCISYASGEKMSNLVKYRIINYFSKWLNDNHLLSKEVTTTFEKI